MYHCFEQPITYVKWEVHACSSHTESCTIIATWEQRQLSLTFIFIDRAREHKIIDDIQGKTLENGLETHPTRTQTKRYQERGEPKDKVRCYE